MTDPSSDLREQQRRRDLARLETFVARARRIESHSLASNLDKLRQLSTGPMTFIQRDGKSYLRYDFPPEEQVESAAARVRPLLLTDVSVLAVLKAIDSLTAGSSDREDIREWTSKVRKMWKRRTAETSDGTSGFSATWESTTTGESGQTDHAELARAWIYGDVVHHDVDHLERTKGWDVGDRFRAAVPLIAYMMVESLNILDAVRELEKHGELTLAPRAWTDAVVADPAYEREVTLHVAPPGTPAPADLTQPLDDAWERVVAPTAPAGETTSAEQNELDDPA